MIILKIIKTESVSSDLTPYLATLKKHALVRHISSAGCHADIVVLSRNPEDGIVNIGDFTQHIMDMDGSLLGAGSTSPIPVDQPQAGEVTGLSS